MINNNISEPLKLYILLKSATMAGDVYQKRLKILLDTLSKEGIARGFDFDPEILTMPLEAISELNDLMDDLSEFTAKMFFKDTEGDERIIFEETNKQIGLVSSNIQRLLESINAGDDSKKGFYQDTTRTGGFTSAILDKRKIKIRDVDADKIYKKIQTFKPSEKSFSYMSESGNMAFISEGVNYLIESGLNWLVESAMSLQKDHGLELNAPIKMSWSYEQKTETYRELKFKFSIEKDGAFIDAGVGGMNDDNLCGYYLPMVKKVDLIIEDDKISLLNERG